MTVLHRLFAVSALALAAMAAGTLHAEPAAASCVTASCASSRQRRLTQVPTTAAPATDSTTVDDEPGSSSDDAPSIIRRPSEEADRPTNRLGVAVGVALFVGWIGAGALMFSRAAKRRRG